MPAPKGSMVTMLARMRRMAIAVWRLWGIVWGVSSGGGVGCEGLRGSVGTVGLRWHCEGVVGGDIFSSSGEWDGYMVC